MVKVIRNTKPPRTLNLLELREWYRQNLGWIPRQWKKYVSIEEVKDEVHERGESDPCGDS